MSASAKKYKKIFDIEEEKFRKELILKYAPLVKQIAERMAIRLPPHICKEELIGPGTMGLYDALDKFDQKKGVKFRTYAKSRIRGAILDELRKMDWVSESVRRDIRKIENAIRTLGLKLGREPEDFEIAEEIGTNIELYHRMTRRVQGADLLSLDAIMPDGFTTKLSKQASDILSPFNELQKKELKGIISKGLSKLKEKERLVMSLYYYEELTLKEIAKVLDLTESRISQIHSKAIIKLRVKLKSYHEISSESG